MDEKQFKDAFKGICNLLVGVHPATIMHGPTAYVAVLTDLGVNLHNLWLPFDLVRGVRITPGGTIYIDGEYGPLAAIQKDLLEWVADARFKKDYTTGNW